jgi:hypothetical protein
MKNFKYLFIAFVIFGSCNERNVTQIENPFQVLENYLSSEVNEGRLKGVHGLIFQNDEIYL